jgi:hypothetical protein
VVEEVQMYVSDPGKVHGRAILIVLR